MDINKIYFNQILEKQGSQLNFKYLDDLRERVNEFETKFKKVSFFKKDIYKQPPKYYLQNKIKKDTKDIQESLKNNMVKLNKIYKDNIYLLDITQDVLIKKENKHIYNIFHVSILEYQKVNLFEDFILESDIFYTNSMRPITYASLGDELKVFLYDIIEDTLNCSEAYATYETVDGMEVKYHNKYFRHLLDTIYEFFVDLYVTNTEAIKLKNMFYELDSGLRCADYFNIYQTLESYGKNPNNHSMILNIINQVIDMEWDINMGILNENRLTHFLN